MQHETSVLLGEEIVVGRNVSVALRVLGGTTLQIHQLSNDLVFARSTQVERGSVAVHLRLLAIVFEAGIPIARTRRRRWIDLVEILEHRGHRAVQAVEIQTIKARPRTFRA